MTTGMSAPPIGSTNSTPKSDAPATTTQSSHSSWTPADEHDDRRRCSAAKSAAFTNCWPA